MKLIKIMMLVSLLSACIGTPISTMWKLRNFDPLEADPSKVRLAVITDKVVRLKDKSTSLSLGFASELSEHNFSSKFHATIRENAKVAELEKFKGKQEHITLFYLDDEAAHKMRIVQNRIRTIKDQDIEGSGSLSVEINTGCFNGPKPEELGATIYARFDSKQGYIKLASGVDLLAEVEKESENFWVECESLSMN